VALFHYYQTCGKLRNAGRLTEFTVAAAQSVALVEEQIEMRLKAGKIIPSTHLQMRDRYFNLLRLAECAAPVGDSVGKVEENPFAAVGGILAAFTPGGLQGSPSPEA
jgi:hypothetical protein